jgi:hypothetical protein
VAEGGGSALAPVVRGLSEQEREAFKAELGEAFAPLKPTAATNSPASLSAR